MKAIKASKKAPKKVKRIESVTDAIGEDFLALFHDDVVVDEDNIYPLFALKKEPDHSLVLDLHNGAIYLYNGTAYEPVPYTSVPDYLKEGGKGSGKYKHLNEKNWQSLTDKDKAEALEALHHPRPVEHTCLRAVTPPDFEAYYIKANNGADEKSVYLRQVGADAWRVFYAKRVAGSSGFESYACSEYTLKNLLLGKEQRAKSGNYDFADRRLDTWHIHYLSSFVPQEHPLKRKEALALAADDTLETQWTAYYWKDGKCVACADEAYIPALYSALEEIARCSVCVTFENTAPEAEAIETAVPEQADAGEDIAMPTEAPLPEVSEDALEDITEETLPQEEVPTLEEEPDETPALETIESVREAEFEEVSVPQEQEEIVAAAQTDEDEAAPAQAEEPPTKKKGLFSFFKKDSAKKVAVPVPAAEEPAQEEEPEVEEPVEAEIIQEEPPIETEEATEQPEAEEAAESEPAPEEEPVIEAVEEAEIAQEEPPIETEEAIEQPEAEEAAESEPAQEEEPVIEAVEAAEIAQEEPPIATEEATEQPEAEEAAEPEPAPENAPAPPHAEKKRKAAKADPRKPAVRYDLPQLISAYTASGKKKARKKELIEALPHCPLIVPISAQEYDDPTLVYVSKQANALCGIKMIPFVMMADKQALLPGGEDEALRQGVMVKTVVNKSKTYIPVFGDFKSAEQIFGTGETFGVFTLKNILTHLSHNESVQGITVNPISVNLKIDKEEFIDK